MPHAASLLDLLSQPTRSVLLLPLRLLGVFALSLPCCVRSKAVNESDDYLLDVDLGVQLCGGGEEGAKGVEVELIREDLLRDRLRPL